MVLAKEMLSIQGFQGVIEERPNGDWLIEWLVSHKCGDLIKEGHQLSINDVKAIKNRLGLPLTMAEKIFLQDLEVKENGRPISKVGLPDRLAKLVLIREDGMRVVTTKYVADDRIRHILELNPS